MTFHALKSCSEEAKILLGVIWKAFKVSQLHFSPRLLGCEHLASVLSLIWNPQGPACSTDDQWWTESSPGFLFWENQTRLGLFSGEIIKKAQLQGAPLLKKHEIVAWRHLHCTPCLDPSLWIFPSLNPLADLSHLTSYFFISIFIFWWIHCTLVLH